MKYAVTPNHTSYLRGMVDRKLRCYIKGGQDRSLLDYILHASQPALFTTTDGECKAPVLDKLHDHSYHVFVRQESE